MNEIRMRNRTLLLALMLSAPMILVGKNYILNSPSGDIRIVVKVDKTIEYNVDFKGSPLLSDGVIGMEAGDISIGVSPKVKKAKEKRGSDRITPVIPFKFNEISTVYNELLLDFTGNYSLRFRAYDDGVAYRIETGKDGKVEVDNETFGFTVPEGTLIHGQLAESFWTSCEELYSHLPVSDWSNVTDRITLLPLLIESGDGVKILVSESDLRDYPGMALKPGITDNSITSVFPPMPARYEFGDRTGLVAEESPFIAITDGKRSFPWRYMVISDDDGKLIENTMTARLAGNSEIADTSWIQPGTTTWEWWSGGIPYGTDVDFEAGCNTDTYKYFVDFAQKYGIDYILLDEGWAVNITEPFTPNPSLNLQEVIDYANGKNVVVILWLPWATVEKNFDGMFKKYADMGVAGLKVDFMDHFDQFAVNFYERVAREAAANGLIIDFHGAYKPSGLEYRYPNILSYEGVRGMEWMGGCIPDNTLYYPFIRNAVGPMDYTPGAMLSYHPEQYRAERPYAGSIGTRAYQLAHYILWETGLQMLADNPTLYYANDDCTRFIADVPVTTDFTKSLAAKAGEYAIVAKKKGDNWYVGGITNGAEQWRDFEVDLDFLGDGEYCITTYEDGANAPVQAMHYVKNSRKVSKGDKLKIRMARNGGYAALITRL